MWCVAVARSARMAQTVSATVTSSVLAGTLPNSAFKPSAIVGMGKNCVSERRIGKAGKFRRLHDGHDLAGLRCNHGEADNVSFTSTRAFMKSAVSTWCGYPSQPTAR